MGCVWFCGTLTMNVWVARGRYRIFQNGRGGGGLDQRYEIGGLGGLSASGPIRKRDGGVLYA